MKEWKFGVTGVFPSLSRTGIRGEDSIVIELTLPKKAIKRLI
jgi:hypothetical protein